MKYKILLLFICLTTIAFSQNTPVTINVDITKDKGPMKHIWAWFGYDEPNYTYMKNGKKLLSELADLSPAPVYIRTHNLMTTGDGTQHSNGDLLICIGKTVLDIPFTVGRLLIKYLILISKEK